ncbi:MAG TPA: S1C family serine protease [Caldimonas sp.]|jgi:S1-C subfamily serine protease|nr:S1C family serine protease [Caldimonas sp.]HEX2539751.1 S1C family serine protease [Caldimonas sp.]
MKLANARHPLRFLAALAAAAFALHGAVAAPAVGVAGGRGAATPESTRVATEQPDPAQIEAGKQKLARAHAAVVGIEATAVEDARSVATLGKSRQGSGVLIGDDGLVLTIGYLILEAERVDVVLSGSRRVPARVVAYDLATGFGLVQALAPLPIQAAPLGISERIGSEEPLLVASGGDQGDLSLARMVSRRAFSGYWEYHIEGALFTAPARTDHSGAALFNSDGELVGIGSLIVSDALGRDAPSVRGNMFVPVDLLKPILGEMRSSGASRHSRRAWLGLNCVEYQGAVRVIRLQPDSPAEEAGVRPGDAIVAVDGKPVADLATFYKTLWSNEQPERDVALDIRRGAEIVRLQVHAIDRMKTLSRPQGV